MQLAHADWLWLLAPLAVGVWFLERRIPGSALRRAARFGSRCALLAVALMAIAGLTRGGEAALARRLIIAVDESSSMTETAAAEAKTAADAAEQAARNAEIEVTRVTFGTQRPTAMPAQGLAAAHLAFAPDETGSVLLITNAHGPTTGLRAANERLRAAGLRTGALAVPREAEARPDGSKITGLHVPAAVRGAFDVLVEVDARERGAVELRIDGAERERRDIEPGRAELAFQVPEPPTPGLHEIAVVLRAHAGSDDDPADPPVERRLLRVGAAPRVLAVLSDPARSPLRAALTKQGMEVAATAPSEIAAAFAPGRTPPDLVVLDASSVARIPPDAQRLLVQAVHHGLGLLLEPGADVAAWEALKDAPLIAALPIQPLQEEQPPPPAPGPEVPEEPLDKPEPDEGPGLKAKRQPEEALPITLLLVIDRSSSMSGDKMKLALMGARAAARALSRWDRIGVITFADEARLDFPVRSAQEAGDILMWMGSVSAGGSTNIMKALGLARSVMAKETAPILHVLLLSDGAHTGRDDPFWAGVVEPMGKRGVTMTALGLGEGHNRIQLKRIVQWARRGRVRSVYKVSDLPTVMTRDTQSVTERRSKQAQDLARLHDPSAEPEDAEPEEEPTKPPPTPPAEPPPQEPKTDDAAQLLPLHLVRRHDATLGFEEGTLPAVGRPRRCEVAPDAARLIVREDERAVLIARRFGLGRVMVWTLPPADPGAAAWDELGRLFGQTAQSVMAPRGALEFVPQIDVASGPDGQTLNVAWPLGERDAAVRLAWSCPAAGLTSDLGAFSSAEGETRRALPAAPANQVCMLQATLSDGRTLPPVSYLARSGVPPQRRAGDAEALRAVFGDAPDPATFGAAVVGRTRPMREPLWPVLLWILVALLPIDVLLHRRAEAA